MVAFVFWFVTDGYCRTLLWIRKTIGKSRIEKMLVMLVYLLFCPLVILVPFGALMVLEVYVQVSGGAFIASICGAFVGTWLSGRRFHEQMQRAGYAR